MTQTLSNVIDNCFVAQDQISRRNKKRSYLKLVPSLGEKKNLVLASIYVGYDTPYDIEAKTGLCVRTVAARISELKKDGYIIETGSIVGKHGKDNTTYKISEKYLPKEIYRKDIEKIVDVYKQETADNKKYTTAQIREILTQQEIKPEIINDIVVQLNLQFN